MSSISAVTDAFTTRYRQPVMWCRSLANAAPFNAPIQQQADLHSRSKVAIWARWCRGPQMLTELLRQMPASTFLHRWLPNKCRRVPYRKLSSDWSVACSSHFDPSDRVQFKHRPKFTSVGFSVIAIHGPMPTVMRAITSPLLRRFNNARSNQLIVR